MTALPDLDNPLLLLLKRHDSTPVIDLRDSFVTAQESVKQLCAHLISNRTDSVSFWNASEVFKEHFMRAHMDLRGKFMVEFH